MKDKVGRKGDNGYRHLRKEEGSSEEGPEMTEICEQGTLLLFVPTMSGPAEKKNLYKVSVQEMLEKEKR